MSQASRALKAYRNALRATSVAFKNDLPTLNAARNEIRTHMKSLEDPKGTNRSIDERLKLLEEVTVFLRRNIVQGRKVDEDKYRLNIHKDTELGDNDDIKKKKDSPSSGGFTGCCGGSGAKTS
ncbi:BA75_02983T0 [Komagataella pastoris]|uniref:Mitochondrial zinc maintenance protein 1, mitochondrial n=1 Tax=Komagataella pastoris TaxID=4922 RepID=A0A1B2JD07_PICPA|nr:BA75_02983T0 [Komagataella pastoris]